MIPTPEPECPDPLRRAFLDILTGTLLAIRAGSDDHRLCLALSDHAHNIPELLADFRADSLSY